MKRIIILEGPDGGGKTTFAKELVEHWSMLGEKLATYDHGPYKGETQIWKHYFDSMLPAYADDSDVLLDRCWLAEPVYGRVMRGGMNRLQFWQERILQHVAASCQTTVVYCMPGIEACLASFARRRAQEYPDSEQKIRDIYYGYLDQLSAPENHRNWKSLIYNYRRDQVKEMIDAIV